MISAASGPSPSDLGGRTQHNATTQPNHNPPCVRAHTFASVPLLREGGAPPITLPFSLFSPSCLNTPPHQTYCDNQHRPVVAARCAAPHGEGGKGRREGLG